MIQSEYSEDDFEGDSEDEGVERSPKDDDHHSSGHHSLSRSPDANSANSLTANPSTPSTTGNVRRVRLKRTSRTSSNKAAKTRQTASKIAKHRPVTPAVVSAIKQHVSQIGAMSTRSKRSAKVSLKRTGTIISMAAPSPLERVVLAKQERITGLTNQLAMKDMEIDELKKENKLLKTVQYRQEKALDRFQNAEADLPQLVNRHAVEMAALKQRLKRSQDGLQAAEHKMREQNEEIWKLKVMLNEVTRLSGDKHLLERDRLRQMLNRANEKLEEKTKRASELEKHTDLQAKTFGHELKEAKLRCKQAVQESEKWHDQYEAVFLQLREKNKELEIKNIYSQRIIKNMPRTLPPVMPTSTQDAAVNTDPITIGDLRPAAGATSRTPTSLVESMVIALTDEKSPSPTQHVPRPPSQPRPPNMPRRNSPLRSSLVLSSAVMRDGSSSNTDDHDVQRSVHSLEREEHKHSDEMQHQEGGMLEGGAAGNAFVTQTSRVETGVGPELTIQKEEQEHDAAELAARAAAEEERRKKDLLLAKLRAMDEGRPTDSRSQQSTMHNTREQLNHASSSAVEQTTMEAPREAEKGGSRSSSSQSSGKRSLDSNVASDGVAVEEVPRQEKPSDTASLISKSSSQHSWNNRVENLHSGRPALSTDRDYYGTQSAGRRAAAGRQKAVDVNQDNDQVNGYAPSVGSHHSEDHREGSGKSLNRRHKPPLTGSVLTLEANDDMAHSSQKLAEDLEDVPGYQSSFGGPKKADGPSNSVSTGRQAAGKTLPLKFGGKKKAYPWETNIPVFPQKNPGNGQFEAGHSSNSFDLFSSEPLLPRREKEVPRNLFGRGAMNSQHETVDDDDIEEVVL